VIEVGAHAVGPGCRFPRGLVRQRQFLLGSRGPGIGFRQLFGQLPNLSFPLATKHWHFPRHIVSRQRITDANSASS